MAFVEKKRWLFFGLPFTFTKYTITEEQITIDSGFLTRVENDCYMYKIQDTVLSVSLLQRVFGIATVICKTSDVTHGQLVLKNIKNAKQILQRINTNEPKPKKETNEKGGTAL